MTDGQWDRRRFLRLASLGAMASAGLTRSSFAAATPTNATVLIIGAGMSGVSAAFWLRQFGISSIILEGRNRLGGRINTSTYWPDAPLDIGAAWIHDAPHSPLLPLAKLFGIGTFPTDFINVNMYGLQNQPIPLLGLPPSSASMGLSYGIVFALVDEITNALANLGVPDMPLANVVDWVLNALGPWNAEELAGVQSIIDTSKRLHYSADLEQLSLYNYNKDKNLTAPEALDLAFPQGYIQLVNALANAAGQPISLNCIVNQIKYDDNGVTAVTSQGVFTAKYAIVTLPIGVLQKSQGNDPLVQFSPPLPDWKLGAINRLGMGRFDKFAMRFPTNFWGNYSFLHNTPQPSNFNIWFNPAPMLNQPVLVPVVFGDFAKQLETVPNDKLVSMLMNILKPLFAAQNPPIPVPDLVNGGFQRSNWGSDQFAFGSLSYIPPGASPVDRDIMSLAVPFSLTPSQNQRLFFAGEATSHDHSSSVWGAYDSGLREAFRIWLIALQGNILRDQAKTAGRRRHLKGKVNPAAMWRAYDGSMKKAYRLVGRGQPMIQTSRKR